MSKICIKTRFYAYLDLRYSQNKIYVTYVTKNRPFNRGLERFKTIPLSVRMIREIHEKLMTEARTSQYSHPVEFRSSQNWIGGTMPSNAILFLFHLETCFIEQQLT